MNDPGQLYSILYDTHKGAKWVIWPLYYPTHTLVRELDATLLSLNGIHGRRTFSSRAFEGSFSVALNWNDWRWDCAFRLVWKIITGWWFGTFGLWLSIYWECHNPNWRTPSFFRGVGIPPTRLITIIKHDQPVLIITNHCFLVTHRFANRPRLLWRLQVADGLWTHPPLN